MAHRTDAHLTWTFVKDVWRLVEPYRVSIRRAIFWILAMQTLALVEPYFIMRIIDDLVRNGEAARPRVVPMALLAFGLLLVTTYVKILKDRRVRVVSTRIYVELPIRATKKLLSLPLGYHQTEHVGEVISSVNSGTGRVMELAWMFLYDVIPVLVQTLVVAVAIAFVHWSIPLIVLVTMTVFLTLLVIVKRRWADHRKERHEIVRKADRLFSQSVLNVMTVQAFGREPFELERISQQREINDRMFHTEVAAYDRSNFGRNSLVNFSRIGIIILCAYLVFGHRMSVASIVFATMLTERLFNACFMFGGIYDRVIDTIEPVRVITKMFAEQETVTDPATPVTLPPGPIRITLDRVTYAYPNRKDDPTLLGVDLDFSPGTMIGIVGESGHGKSTLAKLLLRFDDPMTGTVAFNGIDVRQLRIAELRSCIGYVPQEVELFDDTVAANIRYGNPDATDAEVEAAAKLAHAHDFVMSLEQKYETLVGSRGLRLSGGQRQRIGIARAVLRNPRVMLFDEATSSVDPDTIAEIKRAMNELRATRTVIVITHQISTIQDADQIVVLRDGCVDGRPGTHAQLVASNAIYRNFVTKQQQADRSLVTSSSFLS